MGLAKELEAAAEAKVPSASAGAAIEECARVVWVALQDNDFTYDQMECDVALVMLGLRCDGLYANAKGRLP